MEHTRLYVESKLDDIDPRTVEDIIIAASKLKTKTGLLVYVPLNWIFNAEFLKFYGLDNAFKP